jgi:hypothetical protein
LFRNLQKYSPPGFLGRLREADTDKDGQLNRMELSLFFMTIKIKEDEVKILLKMAGIGPSKERIGFEEFKNICEDRPIIESIFIQRVFQKLIREALRVRALTYEQLFDKLDTNDDKMITAEDLRVGF